MRSIKCFWIVLFLISTGLFSCSKDKDEAVQIYKVYNGNYGSGAADNLKGFFDYLPQYLSHSSLSETEFKRLSTAITTDLPEEDRIKLKSFRESLPFPVASTLLQKVIPLNDIGEYMDNVYGGTVGGFVSVVGDVKSLKTMYQVYWGLRLDYAGTKFKPDGAGYALIRFYSYSLHHLYVPYGPAMGGDIQDPPPFGGGGFTTSTLGFGGTPEYKFDSYYTPSEGAELYESTPSGNLILRSVYTGGKWRTYEGSEVTVKSVHVSDIKPLPADTYFMYKGEKLLARGETAGSVHLFSFDPQVAERLGMEVYDKGEYRTIVEKSSVTAVL